MSLLSEYQGKYECARLERRDGILQVTLHTGGDSLRWGLGVHTELPALLHDIAEDAANKVVILTGTGAEFIGPRSGTGKSILFKERLKFDVAARLIRESRQLLLNLLDIEVPVISAVNGPAWRHGEMPLLADIVLLSDTACFQDSAHFVGGQIPGDGMHVIMPLLMGMNRGRHFLLTGQTIDAKTAVDWGLAAEIHPQDKLLPRAWELAAVIAEKPMWQVRLTRTVLVEHLRKHLQDLLGFGVHASVLGLSYIDEE
jgi:enoyl-CoA hydratase/carnithine racemase